MSTLDSSISVIFCYVNVYVVDFVSLYFVAYMMLLSLCEPKEEFPFPDYLYVVLLVPKCL